MSNLYRGPSIHAFYQISVHLGKRFQMRFFRNQPIRNKNCLWWPCLFTDQVKFISFFLLTNIPRILFNQDLLIFVPRVTTFISFHHEKCQKRHQKLFFLQNFFYFTMCYIFLRNISKFQEKRFIKIGEFILIRFITTKIPCTRHGVSLVVRLVSAVM
jgi:hypothetical protein